MGSGVSQHSSVEMLIELHRDDPEFRRAISARTFRAGQAVAEPDSLLRNMLILIKGRVQLVREGRHGRRLALATLNPGAMVWEDAWHKGQGRAMSANALTACVVWMAPSPQARQLFLRYNELRCGMLQSTGDRLTQVENRMEEVAFVRLPERLAWLLLDLASGGRFVTATSHNSLADMLGTYRETISAILRNFQDTGLVKLGYRKIELCDAGGLRAAAGSLPYYGTSRIH